MSIDTPTMEPRNHQNADYDETSVSGLLTKLGSDISDLVGTEMSMARAEINHSVEDMKTGATSLLLSGVVLLAGAMVLLAAVCLALAQLTQLSAWVATLIVGVVVTVIGVIMLQAGKSKLATDNLVPSRTQNSLQKDKTMVENKLS